MLRPLASEDYNYVMRVIPDHDEVISLETCPWKVQKGIKFLAARVLFCS